MKAQRSITTTLLLFLVQVVAYSSSFSLEPKTQTMLSRKSFFQSLAACAALLSKPGDAFAVDNPKVALPVKNGQKIGSHTIAYRALNLPVGGDVTNVPVACWYPVGDSAGDSVTSSSSITYPHRISVRRIGQMLAGWDWIPQFASRDFPLQPSSDSVLKVGDYDNNPLPAKAPVVFLAHGYLGSRFDLSHIAESLAAEGFVCFSPEFPESLAASYDRREGLDRSLITNQLLQSVEKTWNVQATSYGIVGHSLGCGTAIRTGDATWTRVCISGNPGNSAQIPGNILFLSSMNDGVVSLRTRGGLEAIRSSNYVQLNEQQALTEQLPNRAALIFDRPDAPNHISFLAEGVNDAMVDFLSPLLPVAQALSIPVLDFDRYQASRDSIATAEVVRPLVTRYLKQHMKMT